MKTSKNYENDKKEMRASGLAEIAKVLQTTPNYLLGFADNNDGFAFYRLRIMKNSEKIVKF